MSEWRFIDTGHRDGAANMAIDETLLERVAGGVSSPVIRVYGWRPPAVSIGYYQIAEEEVDVEACAEAGVDVVRRPTGGRAVFHCGELTYAVVGLASEPPLGRTIADAYGAIAEALVCGLRALGVPAETAPVSVEPAERQRGSSPPCFVSSARFEVVVGGRKLVGSAQRRHRGGVLQHGSLLIDDTHARLAQFLLLGDDKERELVKRALLSKTTNLVALLGEAVEFERVAGALAKGFAETWGVRLSEDHLSVAEVERAGQLANQYRTMS